jgi:hypothetical protein
LKAKRKSWSKVRIVLTLAFLTAVGFTALCGIAAGQYYGPCPGFSAMPLTVAGPGGAIASAGGVTALAGTTGAIASAGGVTAGASGLFPAAFDGPVVPVVPFHAACPVIV